MRNLNGLLTVGVALVIVGILLFLDYDSNRIQQEVIYHSHVSDTNIEIVNDSIVEVDYSYDKYRLITSYKYCEIVDYGTAKYIDSIKCIRLKEITLKDSILIELNKPCK